MIRSEMLERMSAREFWEWIEYDKLQKDGIVPKEQTPEEQFAALMALSQ